MKNYENIENQIDNGIKKLITELKQGKSENLINYLKFCSNFYNYSANNIMWIYQQMPTATKVANFKTWSKLGYKIKYKSKSLKVLRPQEYIYILENGEKIFYSKMTREQKNRTNEHRKGITFLASPVFDMSQVEKINGSEDKFFTPLGDTYKEQYLNLLKIINGQKIEVIETNETFGAEGLSYGGLIKIKKDIDYNNKLLILIHEFAHEFLDHGPESDRCKTTAQIRECRAEAISFIVGNYLGLHNPFTSDYLQSWGNSVKEFKENLDSILKVTKRIIHLIEENKNQDIVA